MILRVSKMFIGATAIAAAFSTNVYGANLPHLDLEMSSEEYRDLTEALLETEGDDPLKVILEKGKRNLDWIDFINAARANGNKLELSTPATQRGIPITEPSSSNRNIVMAQWDEVLTALPAQMVSILIDGADFSSTLEISDEDFLLHARLFDRTYQRAARWLLQEPYLAEYAEISGNDVRGYYFLANDPDAEINLQTYRKLPRDLQSKYEAALLGICRNAEQTLDACKTELNASLTRNNNAVPFFRKYNSTSAELWSSYFDIPTTRTDVVWNSQNSNELVIPFLNPLRPTILNWLRDNIEDEFKWLDWRLKLDFQDTGDENMTHVEFVPGATPHVNRIAGSIITMDGNRNIDEYSSRWTIRHEYGHVLGFPDCYLEFYDVVSATMINYQLDITDLMCSRRGAFKENHYDQLKRAYFRN